MLTSEITLLLNSRKFCSRHITSLRRLSVGLHLLFWAFSTAIKDTGKNLDTVNLCVPSPKKRSHFLLFLLPFPPHVAALLNNNLRMSSCFFSFFEELLVFDFFLQLGASIWWKFSPVSENTKAFFHFCNNRFKN